MNKSINIKKFEKYEMHLLNIGHGITYLNFFRKRYLVFLSPKNKKAVSFRVIWVNRSNVINKGSPGGTFLKFLKILYLD